MKTVTEYPCPFCKVPLVTAPGDEMKQKSGKGHMVWCENPLCTIPEVMGFGINPKEGYSIICQRFDFGKTKADKIKT